jgi:PAS domain S-box-containing protein
VRDVVIVANARTESIVLWNPAAERLFGYSTEEALRTPLHMLVPEDLRAKHRAGLARYEETGGGPLIDASVPLELKGLRKNGSTVDVELTLSPIDSINGEDIGRHVLAIIRDLNERRQAEQFRQQLSEAEMRRRQALEINDKVLQGVVTSRLALDLGHLEQATDLLERTVTMVRGLMAELLGATGGSVRPGDLRRESPATLTEGPHEHG